MILRSTVISSKQSFRYNKMYKSNLDPGEGNEERMTYAGRHPFLNMYMYLIFLKSPVKSFENDFVDK